MGNDDGLEQLSDEANRYYKNVMNGNYDYDSFYRQLKYKSLQEIEEKIDDYEQKTIKFQKIKTSDFLKKHKIEIKYY